ncbi:MAG: squalene/phytoene synthase family protein, partial [Candidatus Promineifilaceae bacterium]
AYEALDSHTQTMPIVTEKKLLTQAYQHCVNLTSQHSKTFFLASALLPSNQRLAVRGLYAFCRVSDDLVDQGGKDRLQKLQIWRQHSLSQRPPLNDQVALAWADTRSAYNIPQRYAEQLLDGITSDLTKTRYATFSELTDYCYSVASTVGLMAMHIIGYHSEEAIPYAVKLGVALQLTNILRDVAEDWQNGRLYLPLDELAPFLLTEADIASGIMDERWHSFMKFQIARIRQLYAEALPGIGLLHKRGRFAIQAAAELYQGILDDIEKNNYNVFDRRAHLNKWQKLRRLPGIFLRSQTIYKTAKLVQ